MQTRMLHQSSASHPLQTLNASQNTAGLQTLSLFSKVYVVQLQRFSLGLNRNNFVCFDYILFDRIELGIFYTNANLCI